MIAVLADKAELFNEASQANPSATLPGFFENGVVLGKILESVPFSMALRAGYAGEDQLGVGGMEGFCRLASLHEFMSTSASRTLRDGGMYGYVLATAHHRSCQACPPLPPPIPQTSLVASRITFACSRSESVIGWLWLHYCSS